MSRLPDFILIGAMKAGTTTLFERLGQVPGVALPSVKEPHFFSAENTSHDDLLAYMTLFRDCHGVTGEASASYSDPSTCVDVAGRIYKAAPEMRILYSLRDPVARMRSHYRHQVLRSRETRPFGVAVDDPRSEYIRNSLYGQVLDAYLKFFHRDQILAFPMENLDDADPSIWYAILDHIGAKKAPMDDQLYNASEGKRQFTPTLLWFWERGFTLPSRTPPSIRRLAKGLLTRDVRLSPLIATANDDLPDHVVTALNKDQDLVASLGVRVSPRENS